MTCPVAPQIVPGFTILISLFPEGFIHFTQEFFTHKLKFIGCYFIPPESAQIPELGIYHLLRRLRGPPERTNSLLLYQHKSIEDSP